MSWNIYVALNFRGRLNAYFAKKNMGRQKLKSVTYLIAEEMVSNGKNKRLSGSLLKYTT